MSNTLTFGFTVSDGTADQLVGSIVKTGAGASLEKIDVELDSILTAKEVTLPCTTANLLALAITSPIAATVKTNSTGSPDNTYGIAAGGFVGGVVGSTMAPVVDADLVKVYITTLVALAGGRLRIWILRDVTP